MKASRQTRQRDVVFSIVASTNGHPTADWIYAEARKQLPNLSLGTVYRNLQVLEREGRVRAIDSWGKPTRFDADLSDHYHFVCLACGSISDLPRPPRSDSRVAPLAAARGYTVTGHKLEFEGYCPDCGENRGAPTASRKGEEKCRNSRTPRPTRT